MSTLTFDRRGDQDGAGPEDEGGDRMPRRPRRRLLTRWSALLLALMTCAIGFYVGIRVEKGHIASTPSTIGASGAGGFAAALRGASTGASGAGASGTGAAGGAAAGGSAAGGSAAGDSAAGGAGAGGFAARFGGGGNATLGTVASIDGKTLTLTLTETSGNTVKVQLTSATKITKTQSAKRSQIHPGDTVTVSGVTGKRGTVSAASVSDSGTRTTGGSSGSGSSGGGSVSSLFSGG